MALKRKVTKSEYEALSDVIKAEYKASGDGYVLDTDDATDLITARDKEKEARRKAEKEAKDAQDELDRLKEQKNRENGDIAAIEKSWQTKFDNEKKRADTAEASLTAERNDRHVTGAADKIAKRFTVPELMRDRIAKRLTTETADGKTLVRVLDKDGKPSAMSVDELEKEFVDNADFKSIVIGSKASGSATPSKPGASGPNLPNQQQRTEGDLSKLPVKDLVEHMKGLVGSEE